MMNVSPPRYAQPALIPLSPSLVQGRKGEGRQGVPLRLNQAIKAGRALGALQVVITFRMLSLIIRYVAIYFFKSQFWTRELSTAFFLDVVFFFFFLFVPAKEMKALIHLSVYLPKPQIEGGE